MMRPASFRKGIDAALAAVGFVRRGKTYQFESPDTVVLVGLQKEHGDQWFINVGFWLRGLGDAHTDRVEQTHLYFRLERLFPRFRETILVAGALDDDSEPRAYDELVELLRREIGSTLKDLATVDSLRDAMRAAA